MQYAKNSNGTWIKVPSPSGKYPAWSQLPGSFVRGKLKKAIPEKCAECGKITIPLAMHPDSRKIKFCTMSCGKDYIKKHPIPYSVNVTQYY